MNRSKLKGGWNILRGKLTQWLGQFTGDVQQCRHGQEQELLGQIQKRAGQMDKSAESALHEWVTAWQPDN